MYGQHMQCPDAIGVVTRKEPFSVIPIEFCRLSQQLYKKALDPENTSLVLQKATKKPNDRFRAIEAARVCFPPPYLNGRLTCPQVECAKSLPRSGLNADISSRPMRIPARQLLPPDITFGERRTESAVRSPPLPLDE